MKVDIRDILKIDGAALDIEFTDMLENSNSIDPEIVFEEPVSFKGRLVNVTGILKLDGRLAAQYKTRCYRCLKELKGSLELKISEDIVSTENNTDLEAYTYENYHIDLDKILVDNLVLNLPMKTVCSDACKGLCSVCGSDLNEKDCCCSTEAIDPRLEGLKKFFNS
ncbi:MAG: DUF177 domain-containing protein [Bacillota bacterium]|nr:DUF177 domain-containing protein [Bacillota bacterium]